MRRERERTREQERVRTRESETEQDRLKQKMGEVRVWRIQQQDMLQCYIRADKPRSKSAHIICCA